MRKLKSVCVYCGSSAGSDPAFSSAATEVGRALAGHGLRLVYGGGDRGLMGAVARGALEGGGAVLGIIPDFLLSKEQPDGASDLEGAEMRTVPDMHTRKRMMADEADAFVALPGGIGTLEELIEMLTWSQLRRHDKPVALLNVNGFWDPLARLIDHMDEAGFLHNAAAARPGVYEDVGSLIAGLRMTESE